MEQFPGTLFSDIDIVVLDECDRCLVDDLGYSVSFLSVHFTGKIVLLSRNLPAKTLKELFQDMCFIPVCDNLMVVDYMNHDSENIILEVHSLGSGKALIDDQLIPSREDDLPRMLFFFLIDRGITTADCFVSEPSGQIEGVR